MFKKYMEKKNAERFKRMEVKIQILTDEELKEWYQGADTQRVLGNACRHEINLLHKIEEELCNRGFVYMEDF